MSVDLADADLALITILMFVIGGYLTMLATALRTDSYFSYSDILSHKAHFPFGNPSFVRREEVLVLFL